MLTLFFIREYVFIFILLGTYSTFLTYDLIDTFNSRGPSALSSNTVSPHPLYSSYYSCLTRWEMLVMGSTFLTCFVVFYSEFISRKCCPPTLRRIRQCSMIQNHRQLRSQTRLHMSNMSDQGPYNEYEPTHEGPFIIINGYGQCKCQQLPYKECEV